MPKCCDVAALILFSMTLRSAYSSEDISLRYQDRGNRYEGIRRSPVSGFTIELLSAAIANEVKSPVTLSSTCQLRFFLGQKDKLPYVTVRDVENRFGYWLDHVKPDRPWTHTLDNTFVWPTKDVIARIEGLDPTGLGVIVRLGKEAPSAEEYVAPAFLSCHSLSPLIGIYEFTFRTNATAQLSLSVNRTDSAGVVPQPTPENVPQWNAGVPLRVIWLAAQAAPGEYRLVINGLTLQNHDRFEQIVRFDHRWHTQ